MMNIECEGMGIAFPVAMCDVQEEAGPGDAGPECGTPSR